MLTRVARLSLKMSQETTPLCVPHVCENKVLLIRRARARGRTTAGTRGLRSRGSTAQDVPSARRLRDLPSTWPIS